MKKYVLTGGPCSGKTTLLDELGKRGYSIVEETARKIIKSHSNLSHKEKQERIFKSQLEIESSLRDEIYFLDRSLIDVVAYSRFHNTEPPSLLKTTRLEKRYDLVFVLEMLKFKKDEVRIEQNEEDAKWAHRNVIKAYQEYGYNLIFVPKGSVEQRADFIERVICGS